MHDVQGKELRLKQQHFMVSATLQDIVRRFKEHEADLEKLPEKVRYPAYAPPVTSSGANHQRALSFLAQIFSGCGIRFRCSQVLGNHVFTNP